MIIILYYIDNIKRGVNMFNLIIILLSTINSEPKDSNNYKIAKYLIENIKSLDDCTLTELARKCYVSNSSISRFCRDIGLKDFNDLKKQVAIFPMQYKQLAEKFNFKEYDENSLSHSYILSIIDNLKHMIASSTLDNDIISAKALGMKTVWLKNGLAKHQSEALGRGVADYQIHSLSELLTIL